jgi:hypothetical protein
MLAGPPRLVGHNHQARSGSIDCSDFSCGWPMQAGRPFSRNSLWIIPQRTQALESKSKRCPRADRSSGILALACGRAERLLLHLRLGITGGRQFRIFMGAVYRHHVHPMVLRPVMASTSGCGG